MTAPHACPGGDPVALAVERLRQTEHPGWGFTPPAERAAALAVRAYLDGDPQVSRRDVAEKVAAWRGQPRVRPPLRLLMQTGFAGVRVIDLADDDGPDSAA